MSARELSRDYYGNPPDEPDTVCECGAVQSFGFDFCDSGRCPECCAAQECHVECSVCHHLTDEFEVDEGTDPVCVNCAVAAMDLAEELAERDLVALEAKGDEMREAWR